MERALEGAQVGLGGDDRRRIEAEGPLERALAPPGAGHVKERRREGSERVHDAREPSKGARHDQAHRAAAAERVKLGAVERGEQAPVGRGHRSRAAVWIDGRADPSVALDRHVEVEAAQPVRERAGEGVHRVVLVERGEERREPGAHLGAEGGPTAALAPRRELRRSPRDRPVLCGRRAMVVVEPDEIDRGHASGVERRRALAERKVVGRRHPAEPGRRDQRGHALHRRRQELLVKLGPVDVPRELAHSRARRSAWGPRRSANSSGVVDPGGAKRRKAAPILCAQERAKRLDRVGVVVLVVLRRRGSRARPRCRPGRARSARRATSSGPRARPPRGTSARSRRGTRRSRSSGRERPPGRSAGSPGGPPVYAPGTRRPRRCARAARRTSAPR